MKVFFNIICITIIICTLFGCRNTTPPNENHIEKKDSTLIKDSVLLEKTLSLLNYIDSIDIQGILMINFDSIEYRHSKHMRISVYVIPYFNDSIQLICPKINDIKIVNNISNLLKIFSIDNLMIILRLMLMET